MTKTDNRKVIVQHVRLWNGERVVYMRTVFGVVDQYLPGGYAATVRFRGFRGLFVIPVRRLMI